MRTKVHKPYTKGTRNDTRPQSRWRRTAGGVTCRCDVSLRNGRGFGGFKNGVYVVAQAKNGVWGGQVFEKGCKELIFVEKGVTDRSEEPGKSVSAEVRSQENP